jgi:hypothetical protein
MNKLVTEDRAFINLMINREKAIAASLSDGREQTS